MVVPTRSRDHLGHVMPCRACRSEEDVHQIWDGGDVVADPVRATRPALITVRGRQREAETNVLFDHPKLSCPPGLTHDGARMNLMFQWNRDPSVGFASSATRGASIILQFNARPLSTGQRARRIVVSFSKQGERGPTVRRSVAARCARGGGLMYAPISTFGERSSCPKQALPLRHPVRHRLQDLLG